MLQGGLVGRRAVPDADLGMSTGESWRYARRMALGDRRAPFTHTPVLVAGPGDEVEAGLAPFVAARDSTALPPRLRLRGVVPLAMPFEGPGPDWSASPGHVLPPSIDEADIGPEASDGHLVAVSWQRLRHDPRLADAELRPQVVALVDALQLAGHPGRLAEAMLTLRERWPGALLWPLGVAGPDNAALLAWMGADLLDLSRSRAAAAADILLDRTGPRPPSPAHGESSDLASQLVPWRAALAAVHDGIRRGDLRRLVEAEVVHSARSVEHLRHHDRLVASRDGVLRHTAPPEQRFRTHTAASLTDPAVVDWGHYVADIHLPPPSQREVLLLLPCSARKPYRESQSHRRFGHHIPHSAAHQVMVTSPLGLVPRELEDCWPARHYDVPVTGDWSADETGHVLDLLARTVARVGYRTVIDHEGLAAACGLDPAARAAWPEALREVEWIDTRQQETAGSGAALARLEAAVRHACEGLPGLRQKQLLIQQVRAVVRRELGDDAWMEGTRIGGRPPRWLIERDGVQLGQWHPEQGRVAWSPEGIRTWHVAGVGPWVELAEGRSWKGDVFGAHVVAHSGDLRQGAELRVLQGGVLIGSARATLPGWAWSGAPGRLARSRHRL